MRLMVAAKMALQTTGAVGETPSIATELASRLLEKTVDHESPAENGRLIGRFTELAAPAYVAEFLASEEEIEPLYQGWINRAAPLYSILSR